MFAFTGFKAVFLPGEREHFVKKLAVCREVVFWNKQAAGKLLIRGPYVWCFYLKSKVRVPVYKIVGLVAKIHDFDGFILYVLPLAWTGVFLMQGETRSACRAESHRLVVSNEMSCLHQHHNDSNNNSNNGYYYRRWQLLYKYSPNDLPTSFLPTKRFLLTKEGYIILWTWSFFICMYIVTYINIYIYIYDCIYIYICLYI